MGVFDSYDISTYVLSFVEYQYFFVLKLYIEFYCVVEPVLFEEAFLFSETSQIVHLKVTGFLFSAFNQSAISNPSYEVYF